MSIATTKKAQKYNPKPVWPLCGNCQYFRRNREHPDPRYPAYFRDKPTCALGGFRVGKTGTCARHMPPNIPTNNPRE